jgi:hypothetical protein
MSIKHDTSIASQSGTPEETRASHTPGPLTVRDSGGDYFIIDAPGRWMELAHVYKHAIRHNKAGYANANLFSAAPDLLAACKAVLKLGRELDKAGIINDPAINAVRAAIAKAEGRK